MLLQACLVFFALFSGIVEEGLAERLEKGNESQRASAVRALARRGEEGDWKLVLDALADPAGEVAEVAQWELGKRADADVLPLVLGRAGLRSRSVAVRRRAAEALGRMTFSVDAKQLRDVFGDGDGEARRLAIWSIERLARSGQLANGAELSGRLARAARSGRDERLRGRALLALAQVGGHDAAREVRRALHARSGGVRRAAVLALPSALGREETEALVEAVAGDSDAAVRLAGVDVLAGLRSPAAARSLVARLQTEPERRIVDRIVTHLRALSGLRYRTDPAPWQAWVEGLPEDWTPATPKIREKTKPGEERSVSFADYRLRSSRVTFLIDLSGSIHVRKGGGTTRKERVDRELRGILERLPGDARFNLVPFAAEPRPWKRELVRATPRNVRAALEFFVACDARGSGDVWEAMNSALEDADVDTLVVITDGAPTGGDYNRLELLVPLLLERNGTRAVSIDSILVDAPRGVARHWRTLADASCGSSISVRLP